MGDAELEWGEILIVRDRIEAVRMDVNDNGLFARDINAFKSRYSAVHIPAKCSLPATPIPANVPLMVSYIPTGGPLSSQHTPGGLLMEGLDQVSPARDYIISPVNEASKDLPLQETYVRFSGDQ